MGDNELFQVIYGKAVNEWDDDLSMQLHTIQGQVKAAVDISTFEPPNEMDEDVWNGIRQKSLSEWPDDWEMQLHEITN